jgi:acyl-coenzyme A thioesterase PaaI-like protein
MLATHPTPPSCQRFCSQQPAGPCSFPPFCPCLASNDIRPLWAPGYIPVWGPALIAFSTPANVHPWPITLSGEPSSSTFVDDLRLLERFVQQTFNGFGCGPDSPLGLTLQVRPVDADTLEGSWRPTAREEGPPGHVHGGVQGILADALAGWCVARHLLKQQIDKVPLPMTKDMQLTYHAPLPLHDPVRLTGRITNTQDRAIHIDIDIHDAAQNHCTQARLIYHLSRRHTLTTPPPPR